MTAKYRVGIIGCGSIANMHYRGYEPLASVEVVAIADPVRAALDEFGDKYGIDKRYADPRQMLDEENLDIVSNCTWHPLHAPLTIAACARKPKAVLCEKPMATCLRECDEMIMVAKRSDVKLAIAHQRRFNAAWNEARELIMSGAIGQPLHVIAKGGQGLLNDCSHYLDMMRYMMGNAQVEWVMGNLERKTERYERDTPIEDRSAGIIQFDNGAQGLLLQELGQRYHPDHGYHGQGGVFHGSDGLLEFDERHVRLLSGKSGGWEEREIEGEDASIGQARELVDWIEAKSEHRGRAENGRAAIEIIMAIYESARRHEVVKMPLMTKDSPIALMIEEGALPVERPGRYDIRAFLLRGESMRGEET
jgi:UDP-N-acetyl-2-amino-2-deoxyglucuronate dehydrogenase